MEKMKDEVEAREKMKGMINDLPIDVVTDIINIYNPIIHVDRSVSPTYPDWVRKVLYPELELVGPSDYDVTRLYQWLHPKQVSDNATGYEIHDELIAKKMIEDCLGLPDLLAIQARGIGFFRKHYSGKAVFGWRSVVQFLNGNFKIPYLIEREGEVLLFWSWLDFSWLSNFPALCFSKELLEL